MKETIIDLIFRGVPEGFLFIYATYVFSKKEIRIRPFMISSILLGLTVYGIRLLPIHNGINNILNLIVLIILVNKVNRISPIKSIQVGIITMILGFICEGINVLMIQYLFKLDINFVFNDPKLKILYGIPSLFILGLIVFIISVYNTSKSKKDIILKG